MIEKLARRVAAGSLPFITGPVLIEMKSHHPSTYVVADDNVQPFAPLFTWQDDEIGKFLAELEAIHKQMDFSDGSDTLSIIREGRSGAMYGDEPS